MGQGRQPAGGGEIAFAAGQVDLRHEGGQAQAPGGRQMLQDGPEFRLEASEVAGPASWTERFFKRVMAPSVPRRRLATACGAGAA